MLLNVLNKIRDTEAEISRLERSVEDKKSLAYELTLSSLQSRFDELEMEFSEAAASEFLDVCSYRLLYEEGARQTITSVSNVMLNFQKLITVVYEVLKSGKPKQRGRFSVESMEETAFDFGYSFAGSLGLMFTVPNERLLFGESKLDETINTVFDLVKAQSSSDISEYAQQLGTAPIRCLYDWASSHVSGNMSAEIKWRRNEEIRADMLIQVPELVNLQSILDEASDVIEDVIQTRGYLFAGDLKTNTFRMTFEEAEEIRGHMDDSFKILDSDILAGELPLGRHYDAVIKKLTKVRYSTEQEETEYILISIK